MKLSKTTYKQSLQQHRKTATIVYDTRNFSRNFVATQTAQIAPLVSYGHQLSILGVSETVERKAI